MVRLPLEGIRILDLTIVWAGPFATKLLGDMGAEVIKIEGPKRMDPLRHFGEDFYMSRAPAATGSHNKSAYFNEYNRDKLGITLDLTHPSGRELFLRLVKMGDIVIENFRADVMEKLGLEYETMREVKPDIIMVSMPGYAKKGVERDLVGYGPNIEQMAGLTALSGYRDGPPQKTGISYGDPIAGLTAAGVMVAALIQRRRTGRGQRIEVSQRDALVGVVGEAIMEWGMNRRVMERTGNEHTWMAPHGCYPCEPLAESDGRPLALLMSAGQQKATDRWITIAVETDEEWQALCKVMDCPELVEDRRYADSLSRWHHRDELDQIVGSWTRRHADYELFHLLQSVGIAAGPVLSPLALAHDPHLGSRSFLQVVQHPEMGANTVTAPTWRLEDSPARVRRPAPCFAEHNRYVFHDLLGLSDDQMRDLEQEGVIASANEMAC